MEANNNIVIKNGHQFTPYSRDVYTAQQMVQRSQQYYNWLDTRRTVRDIDSTPVPQAVIENILRSASTAPSGAHKQPWTFCVVSTPALKAQIREAAEKEEHESYTQRMSDEWLQDLAPLATNWEKPFLTEAPYLIIVMSRSYETEASGHKHQNYYVKESVGIACGMLLTAIHNAGLVAITHTPSPMNFLAKLLNRPTNEKPYLLVPLGYPKANCLVPVLERKPLEAISEWY
jgi:iodotyrosine deiodinase